MSKHLILLRGLPGSGKTTLAKQFDTDDCFAADDFPGLYEDEGGFHPELLHDSHEWCRQNVLDAMQNESRCIVVHNTLTTEREMKPYLDLAEAYEYRVISLIVENRHEGVSVHNVPEQVMDAMENRFSVKLR